MAFQYNPKEAGGKLINDGEYECEVSEAEETTSKAGIAMLKLMVKVWARGDTFHIPDYISNPKGLWKLRQLVEAIGMKDAFEKGSIDPRDLRGKHCLVFVKTRKDETGKYPDQNIITKYSAPSQAEATGAPSDGDDAIPF